MKTDYEEMLSLYESARMYAENGEDCSKAIEIQEKRQQQQAVSRLLLPKMTNRYQVPNTVVFKGVNPLMNFEEREKIVNENNRKYTKLQYEKMKIQILEEQDDLFYSVQLPEGWEIKATDHAMWNDVLDDKGRKRITYFYKGAFYDRDAFSNFLTRFSLVVNHIAGYEEEYEVWRSSDLRADFKEGEKIIFSTPCVKATGDYAKDAKIKEKLKSQLLKWVKQNYPDYADVHAYWD